MPQDLYTTMSSASSADSTSVPTIPGDHPQITQIGPSALVSRFFPDEWRDSQLDRK